MIKCEVSQLVMACTSVMSRIQEKNFEKHDSEIDEKYEGYSPAEDGTAAQPPTITFSEFILIKSLILLQSKKKIILLR